MRELAVAYTQNVTDVDDPLLERATATGVDWVTLAEDQFDPSVAKPLTEFFRSALARQARARHDNRRRDAGRLAIRVRAGGEDRSGRC